MDVECPVCLDKYDLEGRQPKGLSCGHDICSRCVTNLTKSGKVQCPTCRGETTAASVKTNFGMVKFLRGKCEVCNEKMRSARCHHCGKELCGPCLDAHARTLYAEVKGQIEAIHRELKGVMDQSSDQTLLNNEIRSKEEVIGQIERFAEGKKEEIDKICGKLIGEVKKTSDINMNEYKRWLDAPHATADICRTFARSTQQQLGLRYTEDCSLEKLKKLNTEASGLLSNLEKLRKNLPCVSQYSFVPSQSGPVSVGEVVCQRAAVDCPVSVGVVVCQTAAVDCPVSVGEVVCQTAAVDCPVSVGEVVCQTAAVDYTRVTSKAVAGSQGAGAEQFERSARVCVMGDRVVVADKDNHRVKVYDCNLDLTCVIGEKGSGRYNFNHPTGVCSIGDEFYVSDHLNNRIKVYDRCCQLSRMFGTRGAGEAEFDRPLGLAAGPGGHLYVCDSGNYRVKVVTSDGKYVRSIGSKGTGPGQFREYPRRVAVTSDGIVLVTYTDCSNVLMFKSSGEYIRLLIDSIPDTPNPLDLTGITVDQHNRIILADRNNHRLLVLDTSGHLVSTIGARGSQRGQLLRPRDVAVSDRGDLVVYEGGNRRLQVFGI